VNDGSISAGHAKVLAGLEQEEQQKFAAEIKENELSVRQLEKMVAEHNAQAEQQKNDNTQTKAIREYSVKKDKPFLKEFEISVKEHSNVRAKAKADSNGGAKVTLEIGRELDVEQILTQIAELLEKY
jgi:ParB family chromosome partitioning protein